MYKKITIIIIIITLLFVYYTGDISKVVVMILTLYAIYLARFEKNWFNPIWLYIVTPVSYMMYAEQLGGIFLDELSLSTKIFVPLCLFALLLGMTLGKRMSPMPLYIDSKNEPFWVVFFVGLVPTVIAYFMYGNIMDLEGAELTEAKTNSVVPFFSQFAYFLPASIIIACKKNSTKLILVSLFFSLIAALFTITKTALVMMVLFFAMGIYIFRPSFTNTLLFRFFLRFKFVIVPILLVLMFMYNNNKRNISDTRDMEYVEYSGVQDEWGTSNLAQNLFLDYCYFCSPWYNLDYNIRRNNMDSFGANTFSQFFKKIGANAGSNPKLNPSFLNTHTYLTDYYLDFGFIGSIVASFLLGFFIYFCYARYGCSDDPILISFYVLIMYATCMLFFSNHFNIGYILNYFITFGLTSFITRKIKN